MYLAGRKYGLNPRKYKGDHETGKIMHWREELEKTIEQSRKGGYWEQNGGHRDGQVNCFKT